LYVPTPYNSNSFNFNITPKTTSRRKSCASSTATKKDIKKFASDHKLADINKKMILDASLNDGVSDFMKGTIK
jgi:hypothetical protein